MIAILGQFSRLSWIYHGIFFAGLFAIMMLILFMPFLLASIAVACKTALALEFATPANITLDIEWLKHLFRNDRKILPELSTVKIKKTLLLDLQMDKID